MLFSQIINESKSVPYINIAWASIMKKNNNLIHYLTGTIDSEKTAP